MSAIAAMTCTAFSLSLCFTGYRVVTGDAGEVDFGEFITLRVRAGRDLRFAISRSVPIRGGKSRQLVLVALRLVAESRVRFEVGGFDGLVGLGQVLLQLPQVVVRQHDGMPAVGLGHEVIMRNLAGESTGRTKTATGPIVQIGGCP